MCQADNKISMIRKIINKPIAAKRNPSTVFSDLKYKKLAITIKIKDNIKKRGIGKNFFLPTFSVLS
jgi:hypothetical protein